MVRRQVRQDQLFYTHEEVTRPHRNNFYIRLKEAGLDWEKMAKPLEMAFSRGTGRPTDPVVYLKAFLVGYFEGIIYDTDLAERIDDSKAIREFLGYNLCEPTPDHSSISRNRSKIAQTCRIEDVLKTVVDECIKADMVDGELCALDASLVPANASLSSLRSVKTGKSVNDHLKEVLERNKAVAESGGKPEKPRVSNEEFVSKTDPDARIAQKHSSPRDMCYLVTHVTDKSGIILAAGCAHYDDGEREAAKPVLKEAKGNLAGGGLRLNGVAADTGYDSSELVEFVEELGAEPFFNYKPDPTKKADGFRKESFVYDETRDCYICPRGCLLQYHCYDPTQNRKRYLSKESDCAVCPDKDKCTGISNRRWLSRNDGEESRERNIARCHTDEGRAALKARKHIVEPPFGHMKTYGGMGLINCRGMKKALVKTVMGAAAYDLLKLVRFIERNKRTAAASLRVLEAGTAAQVAKMPMFASRARQIVTVSLLHQKQTLCEADVVFATCILCSLHRGWLYLE